MDLTERHNNIAFLQGLLIYIIDKFMRRATSWVFLQTSISYYVVDCNLALKSHAKIIIPVPDRLSLGHN